MIPGVGIVQQNQLGLATHQDLYAYVEAGPADIDGIKGLPGKSLIYKTGSQASNDGSTAQGSILGGVPLSAARTNGWVLKKPDGTDYICSDGAVLLDVGSAAYQADWVARVAGYLDQHAGCDGVFVDNVVADLTFLGNVYPTKYPSQATWETAMASWCNSVGPAVKARGYYILYNAIKYIVGDGGSDTKQLTIDWWNRVGASSSGLMNEYWMQDANNHSPTGLSLSGSASFKDFWETKLRLVTTAQGLGRDFHGLTYGSTGNSAAQNQQIARYGRGSMLMEWNGNSAFEFRIENADPYGPWVFDVGVPTGPKTMLQTGVCKREFSFYTVYVNATSSPKTVEGVTVPAADAVFLQVTAPVPTPTPTPTPPPAPDLKSLVDVAVSEAKLTTVGYINKRWSVPPEGSHWEKTLTALATLKSKL